MVHTHTGNPCSICGFPLSGIDAINYLQGGIRPPQVHRVEKTDSKNISFNLPVMLSLPLEFLEWKIKLRVRSSDISGKYEHWFPNALTKKYSTQELFEFFMEQRGNGA